MGLEAHRCDRSDSAGEKVKASCFMFAFLNGREEADPKRRAQALNYLTWCLTDSIVYSFLKNLRRRAESQRPEAPLGAGRE